MKRLIKAILKFIFKVVKKITPSPIRQRIKNYLINHYATPSQIEVHKINVMRDDNVLHIAIRIHGGYGDVLISSAWVKELYRRLDCAVEIDVFLFSNHSRPVPFFIFKYMPYKLNIVDADLFNNSSGYDLKMEVFHFIKIHDMVPHRIIDKDKKLYELLGKVNIFNEKYNKYVRTTPVSDGEWANLVVKLGRNRWSMLNVDGAFDFNSAMGILHLDISKYAVLDELGLRNKQYITIHAGFDPNYTSPHVKLWPLEHYVELCRLIKERYPGLLIVQLGLDNSLPVENIDINCLGRLSMDESLIILKHSLLHIDGESGLVHIQRQLHGKSIVLFGPTPIDYFKYEENININSPFYCTNCLWMLNNWQTNCAAGLGYPAKCMEAITPQMVMAEAEKYLDYVLNKKTEITQTAIEIYSTDSLKKYDTILTDICNSFNIEKLPICEHIYYGDAKFYIHSSKQWEYPFVIDKITAYTEQKNKETMKIADVGGGAGLLAPYLARLGYDTTVYDLNFTWDHDGDPERIEKLRLRWAEANGLKMEYGSIFNIPAEDVAFDVVTSVSVVEHVPEKIYAFKEMLRVLKPGGILIITYDLVDSDRPNYTVESARTEIFTPGLIQKTLSELGVQTVFNHTRDDIQKALEDMQRDKVKISVAGIAVGGLVLRKETV